MKETYSEVRCDWNNDEGYWCVDAWRSSDGDEEGKVIAVIHEEAGDVYYIEPEARFSPMAQEVIAAKVSEINGTAEPSNTEEEMKKNLMHRYVMSWSQADGGWMVVYARDLEEAEAKFEDGIYTIEQEG